MAEVPAPVSSDFVVKKATKIVIDHKLGVAMYTINDADKKLLFEVKGPTYVARDVRRVLADSSGKDLVYFRNKIGSWHDRWFAFRDTGEGDGNLLFSMSKCSIFQITPCFEIFLPANETSTPDFTVKGNFREKNYKIFFNNILPIAEAKKRFSLAFPVAIGNDHYGVTVFPGGDQAFIASVVVIINEVKEDKRREIQMY